MTAEDVFTVDAAQLTHTVDELATCGESLHQIAADLEQRISALHLTWDGAAARAHGEAQAEWQRGFRAMHEALDQMRAAARVAHTNYTSAADTNLRMWQQVG